MKLTDKTKAYGYSEDYGRVLVGKKKKYIVTIEHYWDPYQDIKSQRYWCYSLEKDGYQYNSLWDDLKYSSSEECAIAAEKKIDELCKDK